MALRTFRSNPSLGGFGGESSAPHPAAAAAAAVRHNRTTTGSGGARTTTTTTNNNNNSESWQDCDAFAQIIKELVDNAVDACCMAAAAATKESTKNNKKNRRRDESSSSNNNNNNKKRVRVVIERFEPPPSAAALARVEDSGDESDDNGKEESPEILRVTVSDNGCGMKNIQDCVDAFCSNKAGASTTASSRPTQPQQQQQNDDVEKKEHKTAGRYGIGLTLCLLHAQRLVPNSCASITSATEDATHFHMTQYVVDTEGDSVRCVSVELQDKSYSTESGTSISVLIPGGPTAQLAWPRLAEYFARFRLSLGIPCSLEVMANTLARVPLFVRPPHEEQIISRHHHQQQQQQEANHSSQAEEEEEEEKEEEDAQQEDNQEEEEEEEEPWEDGFEDLEDMTDDGENSPQDSSQVSPSQLKKSSGAKKTNKIVPVVSPPTNNSGKKTKQQEKEEMRQNMHRIVELYLGHPVELDNVAHSVQPIRVANNNNNNNNTSSSNQGRRSRKRHVGPHLEVTLVVCGTMTTDATGAEDDSGDSAEEDSDKDSNSTVASSDAAPDCATMMMVRMVNRIPLLDGTEATSCGLVQGLLHKKKMWNSFGLEVSSTGVFQCSSSAKKSADSIPQLPTFQVRDSDQVAPFFKSNNHSMIEEGLFGEDDASEIAEEASHSAAGRKRRRNKPSKKWLLPARIRLGKILVIVQIDAEPSSLPLPTLSKGRLPTDNPAIDTALEVAVLECLRSLQKTSPLLLLTSHQLKKAERDARYVPSVTSSLSSIIAKSRNDEFRQKMTNMIKSWSRANVVDAADHDSESEADEAEGNEPMNSQDEEHEESTQGGSQNVEYRNGEEHKAGSIASDSSDEEDDDDSESTSDRHVNRNQLLHKLGENLEARLRQIVLAHDEAPKRRNQSGRPNKAAKRDDGAENEDETGSNVSSNKENGDDQSQQSDGLVSFDFSAATDCDEKHNTPRRRGVRSNSSLGSSQSMDDLNDFDTVSPPRNYDEDTSSDSSPSQNKAAPSNNNFDDDDDDWWPV